MAFVQRGGVLVSANPTVSGQFGASVSLSADGTIMAVGAANETAGKGGVYIYDLVDDVWTIRGSRLEAADGAIYDAFGSDVALSSDGTILAVGAPGWEGAASAQGGVYIYDYTGGAWVARGSVLTAADAAADDAFGTSVALSSNGLVLAVGAPTWEGGASAQGGVYIYDYTGGAWVQRGSVLTAGDAAASSYFGSAVALSSTGAILAVGAERRQGTYSTQGAVYIYDWTTIWTQRGSVITASDAAALDGFGASAALSDDGAILAVSAGRWKSNDYKGRVYIFDYAASAWTERINFSADDSVSNDSFGSGVALSADGLILTIGAQAWEGATTDQGGVYTYDDSVFITAPTLLTVEYPTESTVTCPTKLSVTASAAAITAATTLALINATHTPNWTARCLIDGVDVSSRLVGAASVTAEEGAARIANLTLLPASGVIDPLDYVGKAIVIDYVVDSGGTEVARRLFTGRIDTPAYDPASTLLRLACVDDLQNRVSMLYRATITGLIDGYYSTAVQGEIDDNWDYAEALLTTVQASLDADAMGGLRITPWQLTATWATFDESDLLYERARLSLPQRSTITNRVDIEFEYRYPRLRQRYTTIGWSGTQIDMRPNGYQYPTQQDLLGAASGSGWTVTLGVFYPAPAAIPHSSGGFIYPADGAIDMAILAMTQRHSQTVTETYSLTVTAPESVTINGELPYSLRGALASTFDGGAWESALDVLPLMESGGEMDYAPDASRSDSDYAIQTLLAQARTKILSSHRSARVGNAILCNPDLDVDKRVAIDTAMIQASGKVASVTHILNFVEGSAITEFEIAIFGAGGAGIITPDTLEPPSPPESANESQDWESASASLSTNTYGVTPYQDGLMGLLLNPPENIFVEDIPPNGDSQSFPNPYYTAGSYPVTGFRVRMPGVDDGDRNPVEKTSTGSYSIIVPIDTLTFTVP